MRVCLVSAAYHPYPSGISEHVARLARGLQKLGVAVEVLTTRFPDEPVGGAVRSAGDSVPVTRVGRAVRLPGNGSYATLPVGLRLPSEVRMLLDQRAPDVVHAHGFLFPDISYWALRYSSAVNVVSLMSAPFRVTKLGSGIYRTLFRNQLQRIHGRIAISRRAWSAFEPFIGGSVRIIPCGVETDRFHPDLPGLPDDQPERPVVLFVGRLDPRKGLSVLLDSVPDVRAHCPEVRFVVVGTGPQEHQARQSVLSRGLSDCVTFVGRVPDEDLPRYYAGCNVYCSPALGGEAQGVVLVEAMAAGAPIVASAIPGYDETVRDGIDGLLVPALDPTTLARALVRMLSDEELRARTAGNAMRRVKDEYAMPVIARQTLEYYGEILSRHHGQPSV